MSPRQVFHWSRDTPIPPARVAAAAITLATPVAYGVATDNLAHAGLAALGALGATGAPRFTFAGRWLPTTAGLAAGGVLVTLAGLSGAWLGGNGWATAVGVVGLVVIAAVLGGFSRQAAELSARFTTFLVIATGVPGPPWEAAQWFAVGAAWAVVVGVALAPRDEQPAAPTYRQLARRWSRNLRTMDGWRYAATLAPVVALAELIGVFWHQDKTYWIALTVLIVVRRRGGSLLRATERCLGTLAGVLIGGGVILWAPPAWGIVAIIAVLAGLRPLLRERNYAAYAAVMTPLLVLLLDLGRTPELSTVGYRMIDTIIGCLLALLPMIFRRNRVG
ncbi:FUSC family protein [Kribbella sp. NPDC020789]